MILTLSRPGSLLKQSRELPTAATGVWAHAMGSSRTILCGYMVSYVLLVNVPAATRKCGRRPAASVAGVLGPGTDYTECDGANCPCSGCENAEVMAENTESPCLFQLGLGAGTNLRRRHSNMDFRWPRVNPFDSVFGHLVSINLLTS